MLRKLFAGRRELPGLASPCEASVPPDRPARVDQPIRKALVVDDDADVPIIVKLALSSYGFETSAVSDGASALASLHEHDYDLVILDLGMEELDGFAVLLAMKGEWRLRAIPVIVLTADNSELALARSFGYGADDFVAKPFKIYELGMRAYRLVQPLSENAATRRFDHSCASAGTAKPGAL